MPQNQPKMSQDIACAEITVLVVYPDRAGIAAPGIPLVIARLGVFNLTGAWLALDEVER
tara:strand:+ start:153 stop:329 length:177 start_codon:yes stop_codon:yes gene_type:complete